MMPLVVLALTTALAAQASAQTTPPNLTGTWTGTLVNEPARANASRVDVMLEIGPRLRGDVLEEEMLTIDDQPADKGIQPLKPRSIQRLTLRRQ